MSGPHNLLFPPAGSSASGTPGSPISSDGRQSLPRLPDLPASISTPAQHALALWPGWHTDAQGSAWKTIRHRSRPSGEQERPIHVRWPKGAVRDDPAALASHLARERQRVAAELDQLAGAPDVDLSVQVFRGWRRADLLAGLTCLVLDFDVREAKAGPLTERVAAIERHVGRFLDTAQREAAADHPHPLPLPNLLVRTGRGFHAYWLLDRFLPAKALPRWQAVQHMLLERFAHLQPDRSVTNCTRVLRLVGTTNSKVPLEDGQAFTVTAEVLRPERCDFEAFQRALRYTRSQVRSLREARGQRLQAVATSVLAATPSEIFLPAGATPAVAAKLRAQMRRAAAQLTWVCDAVAARYPGGVPEGARDLFLFGAAAALAWLVPLERLAGAIEAFVLTHMPTMPVAEATEQRCVTLMRRATSAAKAWDNGAVVDAYADPRYTVSWAWYARELSPWLDPAAIEVAAGAAKTRKSRNKGKYTKLGVSVDNIPRALRAHELHAQGHSQREVATMLGVTHRAVATWLTKTTPEALQQACANPSPSPASSPAPAAPLPSFLRLVGGVAVAAASPPAGVATKTSLNGSPPGVPGRFSPGTPRGGSGGDLTPVDKSVSPSMAGSRAGATTPAGSARARTRKGLVPVEVLAALDVVTTLERLGASLRRTRDEDAHVYGAGRLKGQPRPTWWLELPGDSRMLKLITEVKPPQPGAKWVHERRLWVVTDAVGQRVEGGAGAMGAAIKLLGLSFGDVRDRLGLLAGGSMHPI